MTVVVHGRWMPRDDTGTGALGAPLLWVPMRSRHVCWGAQ